MALRLRRTSSVKRRYLHKLIHVGGSFALFVTWITFAGVGLAHVLFAIFGVHLWSSVIVVTVPLFMGLLCGGVMSPWLIQRLKAYDAIQVEPMSSEDRGEIPEIGSGWRRVRFSFAITVGAGRLADHRIEWIELAMNLSEPLLAPQLLGASDAKMAAHLVEIEVNYR